MFFAGNESDNFTRISFLLFRPGANKHQSAVTCLQFNKKFVITSSDDGTVKIWDLKTGEFLRNLVALESGGSGGVVWRIRCSNTRLVCAVGSRNGTEETKLMVLDFDVDEVCNGSNTPPSSNSPGTKKQITMWRQLAGLKGVAYAKRKSGWRPRPSMEASHLKRSGCDRWREKYTQT